MATFVLVHGSFHGGWCYSRVATLLRAKGHEVHAPTLSGLADRAHLSNQCINLDTHIQDVVSVLNYEDLKDVILCGHSYGGMVITGAAAQAPERIKTLFYLDAVVPEDGQSVLDLRGPEAALSVLAEAGETGTMVAPMSAHYFQVKPENIDWVDRMCTPHPIGCFVQKLRLTGREALVPHRTFILTERFTSPVPAESYAKVKDQPGWKTASIDCGHDVMVDEPELLAALLLEELDR